jgi:anaerobic ribonucleoside-triphosphate reductase
VNTESNGITITNMCYQCHTLTELCPDCQELRDSRDADIAHQLVDEGNLQYRHQWSISNPMPSGHDWTDREGELREAISVIADRIYDVETSITVTANETVCTDCHYIHNRAVICPNCN